MWQEIIKLIDENNYKDAFEEAKKACHQKKILLEKVGNNII